MCEKMWLIWDCLNQTGENQYILEESNEKKFT